MLISSVVIYVVSLLLLIFMSKVAQYGRRLRNQHPHDLVTMHHHKKWVYVSFGTILIAIVFIDGASHLLKAPLFHFFWWVHLPLAVTFIVFFGLTWIFDGDQGLSMHPERHKSLAYATFVIGSLAMITGDILATMLISPHFLSALR
jgi:hypothetical protein